MLDLRRFFAALLLSLTVFWSASAAAQCQADPGPAAFVMDRDGLGQRATEVNLWYVSADAAALPFDARIAERKKRIEALYAGIRDPRRDAWASARCTVIDTKKCASSTGNTNRCPRNIAPPPDMRFVPESIERVGSGIKAGPAMSGSNIAYTIGKSGSGSNTGGFKATAVFTQNKVDNQVAAEMKRVEEYVTPILNGGIGTSASTTVVSPSPGGAAAGPLSVSERLALLAKLHSEGKLTDAEYEEAKRRELGP